MNEDSLTGEGAQHRLLQYPELAELASNIHQDVEDTVHRWAYIWLKTMIRKGETGRLNALSNDITRLFASTDGEVARSDILEDMGAEHLPMGGPGRLDAWLLGIRERCVAALAGREIQNFVDPYFVRKIQVTWDNALYEAGSYPDIATANECATAILRQHEAEVEAALTTRQVRLRPLRHTFPTAVGRVLARESVAVDTSTAVLLLHNRGGRPLVFSSYPERPLPAAPDLPRLEQVLGAYFHGDWIDESDDPLDMVRRMRDDLDDVALADLQRDLARLAALDDPNLSQALRGLGSYFVPRPPGQMRLFLEQASSLL